MIDLDWLIINVNWQKNDIVKLMIRDSINNSCLRLSLYTAPKPSFPLNDSIIASSKAA